MPVLKSKKIYIIGPVGSGETTLSKELSKKYNIKYYELDKVVWDDENGNIKRSEDEINETFKNIINQNEWIIEDVGRDCFKEGIIKADIIYYIDLNVCILYYRIIKRWIKQKLNLESYNYKPTINSLLEMFKWLNQDIKNKDKSNNILNTKKAIILKKSYKNKNLVI